MVEVEYLRYTPVVVEPPTEEPVSVSLAKAHCGIDHFEWDATLVTQWIKASRRLVEAFTNRALVTQTWKIFADRFPCEPVMALRKGPIASITHVKYYDTTGSPATWGSGNYILDGDGNPPRLSLAYSATWPGATLQPINGVEIQAVFGYGAASAVPAGFVQAILLLCEHWNLNRVEEVPDQPRMQTLPRRLQLGIEALLSEYVIH